MDYTADFETTTDEEDCRVWAWAACEISEDATVTMGTDMETFLAFCEDVENCDMWFHNLAFDGEFIVNYLLNNGWEWVKEKPGTRQFSTLISSMGKYYQVQVCFKRTKRQLNMVTFKDSLKKLTMSVEEVARAFKLPISKLTIDYDLLATGQQGGGTASFLTVFVSVALPLLTEGGDVILLFRPLIVQLVLGGVDDDHAVFNSLHNVTLRSPFQGHIGDEVRDLTHLYLSGLFREKPDTGLTFGRVFNFSVKSL